MSLALLSRLEGRPDRDYSLSGPEAVRAAERGLIDAQWFRAPIAPDRLRELAERSDARPLFDVVLWLLLLVGMAVAAVQSVGSSWSIVLFLIYGGVYGGASDARWHEFGHGTAARSERVNDLVYGVASFMLWRCPTAWRWSHFRHHSDTIVVGRDPEIQIGRPGTLRKLGLNLLGVLNGPRALLTLLRYSVGNLDAETASYVPASERRKVVVESRVIVGILAVVAAIAVATTSWLPVLLVGLPTIYGAWLMVFFGSTQHLGLREDVLDHRESTRTVLMNPLFRFLYLNMNYHVEHHMFPAVPYYRLPALHDEIKHTLPAPSSSTLHAYREIVSALRHQRHDPDYVVPNRSVPVVESAPNLCVGSLRPDGKIDLGEAASFANATVTRVDVADRTFAVARTSNDVLCVVDGLCTHGNAHLADGTIDGTQIQCPKHRGRFDLLTGASCAKPASIALGVHATELVDGHLIIKEYHS